MAFHTRTFTVTLGRSKAFDTINIHTLIRKLLQTNIPGTIMNFIANYIKGHKAYITYRSHISKQRQFKTDVPQGGVLSPTLPQDAHKIQTYICMTKHSHFPYTSTYSSTARNSNRKHNIHHIPYFNTPRLKSTIFNNARYTTNTFHRPPHRHKNKHVPYTHIYCLKASTHKMQYQNTVHASTTHKQL